MGFSIELFFDELFDLINDSDMKASKKLKLIKRLVEDRRKYAEECGVILK